MKYNNNIPGLFEKDGMYYVENHKSKIVPFTGETDKGLIIDGKINNRNGKKEGTWFYQADNPFNMEHVWVSEGSYKGEYKNGKKEGDWVFSILIYYKR